ncbi:Wzz/FepE/Etk N-terminal domain-containing protein [Vibrio diabolicus]|uniref:Wzz/FepE/Etk N-terminal domain-containing protein n=1 Tax=Vibrio diabolicus TaxID=50719 RepID=UPI003751DC39
MPIQDLKYPVHSENSSISNGSFKVDEMKISHLIDAMWEGKWIILISTLVFAIGSVFYAIKQPDIYRADALLSSSESSNTGGLAGMAGQLGGLAALAGVNIGSNETSQTELAVQVMKSRKFVDSFIKKHDLLVPLLAVKGWDLASNNLKIDDEQYDAKANKWLREPKGLRGAIPSSQEAYESFIKNVFSISLDKDSGLYTVSVKHYSPYIAKQWVDWLISDINKVMRARTIEETTKNVSYLRVQLEKTSVSEMQNTFYKLIEEQMKSLMLAEVQEEFVFKVVDPAIVPELKSEPRRAVICVLGTFIGGILGVLIVVVRLIYRK